MNWKLKSQIVEKYGTQADFAQAVGEDDSFISRIVRGRRKLSPDKAEAWSKLLDLAREDLLDNSPPEASNQGEAPI